MTQNVPDSQPIQLNLRIQKPALFFLIMAMLLLGSILVRNLWISDDSFITMRVINNLLHGYGLVWNVGERVQVFTHPLWLFIILPFAQIFKDPLYAYYVPSLLISLAAIYLILSHFARTTRTITLAAIALGGSMAFMDYSSSGMENPLTHLFLVIFFIVLFREDASPVRKLSRLSLLTALGALNRLDAILFFLPALVYQFLQCRAESGKAVRVTLVGFLPLILWETFATFYYGFPLPNTYHAKAQTGLETFYLLKQGAAYFANSIHWDPFTLGAALLGLISVGFQREAKRILIAVGMVCYACYVLWIGDDFMSGRFFSGIFLAGLVLILTYDSKPTLGVIPPNIYYLSLILLLLLGLTAERPPVLMHGNQPGSPDDQYGIVNEKYYYFGATGWTNYFQYKFIPDTAAQGNEARVAGISPVDQSVIGFFGYHAGPNIYIVDLHALTDPLTAHLPVLGPGRVGHYERAIPPGYRETIANGFTKNEIVNPYLNLYYDKLSILIHGNLFAPGRLREIVNFNLGQYDYLLERYLETPDPK
jgi:arabinofuranosyltransferase